MNDEKPTVTVTPGPGWEVVGSRETTDPTPRQLCALALQKGAGIDVIERFSALAERWDALEAKKRWAEAVAGFKGDCPPIIKRHAVKDRSDKQLYKYVDYPDIKAVTLPLERKHGLVIGFTFDNTTAISLKCVMKITVGSHTEEYTGAVPVPTTAAGGINATQLMGQAQTYLRRYLYVAALDIVVVGEDGDAVNLIETITPHDIGKINDAIEDCQQAGQWSDNALANMLRVYEIESLDQLPVGRLRDLMADLDRQARKGKKL